MNTGTNKGYSDKRRISCKKWEAKNVQKMKDYRQSWRKNNRDKCQSYDRKWYKENSKKSLIQRKELRIANKQEWMKIIRTKGMDKCIRCGYDRCFAAIDFHHINPSQKKILISLFLDKRVTFSRVAELEKTVPLCRNCHMEEHYLHGNNQ